MQTQEADRVQQIQQKCLVEKDVRRNLEFEMLEQRYKIRQYNQIVKKLLATLSLPKTLQCFAKQAKIPYTIQNPQLTTEKSQNLQDDSLTDIIEGVDEKQGSLEQTLHNILEDILPEKKRKMLQQTRESNQKLEKAVQSIFSKKQKATIPIFKILDVKYDNRKIHLCEIDDKQRVFLAEQDQNWIHLIDETGQLKSRHIDNCKDVRIKNIKWTGKFLVVLMSSHKLLLFTTKLQQYKVINLGNLEVTNFDIKFHPHPKGIAQTFARNVHGQISICKINSGQQWQIIDKERYEYNQPLIWGVSILRSCTKKSFSFQEQKLACVNDLWHFYTLDEKMENVLKFDSVTKKVGIIWNKNRIIVKAMQSSSCMRYLLMILTTSKGLSDHYEFLKIDGHGIEIERTHLTFIHDFQRYSLKHIHFLQPEWLCCAQWMDRILYFSLKTGQLIYTQEILIQSLKDGRQELIHSGPNNCLLFKDNTHLRLLSTINRGKRKVLLEGPLIQSREEMVHRLSRIHGLPENLLLLLQTIRTNSP